MISNPFQIFEPISTLRRNTIIASFILILLNSGAIDLSQMNFLGITFNGNRVDMLLGLFVTFLWIELTVKSYIILNSYFKRRDAEKNSMTEYPTFKEFTVLFLTEVALPLLISAFALSRLQIPFI